MAKDLMKFWVFYVLYFPIFTQIKLVANTSKYIKWVWIIAWTPFVCLFLLLFLISAGVFGELPSVEELQNPKSNLATVVYSSDLKTLGKFYSENRVNIHFENLDKDIVNALVATEDARFYEHSGVDVKA